jgi:hypothetical protein
MNPEVRERDNARRRTRSPEARERENARKRERYATDAEYRAGCIAQATQWQLDHPGRAFLNKLNYYRRQQGGEA